MKTWTFHLLNLGNYPLNIVLIFGVADKSGDSGIAAIHRPILRIL